MSFASLKQAFSLLMIKFTQIQYWTNVGWLVWWFQANSAIPIVLMSSFAKVLQENLLVLKVSKPINCFNYLSQRWGEFDSKQAFSMLMIKFTQIQYWTNLGWPVWWFQANSAIRIVLMSSFAKVLQENLLVLKLSKPINCFNYLSQRWVEFDLTACMAAKVETILEQRDDYFSPPSIFVKIQIVGANLKPTLCLPWTMSDMVKYFLFSKVCWQHPAMFCLYTSSKLSRS